MMKGNFDTIINGDIPVLVDFYADWCAPCKLQTPILQEVSAEMNGRVRIIKIDVDRNQAIASRFNIRGVPTLILFRKGKAVWNQPGVSDKRKLIEIINRNL
jgi:thioredoxin 1